MNIVFNLQAGDRRVWRWVSFRMSLVMKRGSDTGTPSLCRHRAALTVINNRSLRTLGTAVKRCCFVVRRTRRTLGITVYPPCKQIVRTHPSKGVLRVQNAYILPLLSASD